ncbi:MAG: glutamate mutase L [Brevefilum sp.]
MAAGKHPYALLGLDIGGVNSRVNLIGIAEGRYQVLGSCRAPTSLGENLHIGSGVGQAMQSLQQQADHLFLKDSGGLLMPVDRIGRGVDLVGLVLSAGPRMKTAVLGLSSQGSLKAARALIDSLPLEFVGGFDVTQSLDETRAVEALINTHANFVIITGGEDQGMADAIQRWIAIARTACGLWPSAVKPVFLFAGNPALESAVQRSLERVANLQIAPNLQPIYGEFNLVPAQGFLEKEILNHYMGVLQGLTDLIALTGQLYGLNGRAAERMMRYLSQAKRQDSASTRENGLLSIDLGGGYTTLNAGFGGVSGAVVMDPFPQLGGSERLNAAKAICDWAGETVTLEEADQFLCNYALIPGWVPDTRKALNLTLALARYRLRQALMRFAGNHAWLNFDPDLGLQGHFEPIIASGAALTQAGDPAGVMLALLDGLQPLGITTMVLDRHHLLGLLGKLGETEPVLPVHVLSSPAFENLGTVISAVGQLPRRKIALTVRVETASGKHFSLEVPAGSLKRLAIPPGESAVLELLPHRRVDIGFGGLGRGGRLKVIGGLLGAVIDARGRPIHLPDKAEARIELLQHWRRTLSTDQDEPGGLR